MKLSEVGRKVLDARYLRKNDAGVLIETPEDMARRVARAIAHVEQQFEPEVETAADNERRFAKVFEEMIDRLDFLPNSPTLMNAGVPGGQLSACFVIPVHDDIESIFDAVKQMALIFKSGGGVGLPMSRLRPKGSLIKSTGGVSSGPVSFMRIYNTTAEVVAQGGKRRGALMGTLRVDHPDILEFIKVKQDLKTLTSFNMSVAITDEFMRALAAGLDYALYDPRTGKPVVEGELRSLSAQKVWDEICECAWKTGEPGLVFIDRINAEHKRITGMDGVIEGTNPCVTGDTVVVTSNGPKAVKDLVGVPFSVVVYGREWPTVEGFFASGKKPVRRVVLESGAFVRATSNHVFYRIRPGTDACRVKVTLDDLQVGDMLPVSSDGRSNAGWHRITAIEPVEPPCDVYDVRVPGVNQFVANGIIVGNCGELPLLAYESCNLGSINLANFVLTPYTKDAEFDHERLAMVAKWAVRFLDNVITANNYPLEEIQTASLASRKIGLGVMGFADALIELGIPYDTEAALQVLDVVMSTIHTAAMEASEALAAERGPFPGCTLEKPRRNATLTAVAPTGSISMIANVTGGIEPLFSVAMKRKAVLDGVPFMQLNDTVVELLKVNQYKDHQIADIVSELWCGKSFATATGGYKGLYRSVVCAHEVPPSIHVQMQATAQRWSDSAVSKTVNLPHDATRSEVYSVFLEAYQSGCKGITAYRSDSREDQPMNAADGKSADTVDVRQTKAKKQHVEYGKDFTVPVASIVERDSEGNETGEGHTFLSKAAKEWLDSIESGANAIEGHNQKLTPKERPQVLSGHTIKMQTGCGTLYVTINVDAAGNLTELFASHGKAGVCSQAQCEAIGRLSSMSLRAGVDPQAVINQLRGITCHETAGMGPSKVLSCADGIAKAIVLALEKTGVQVQAEQVVEADDKADDPNATRKTVPVFSGACPDCGAGTIREAGCVVCKACGWNKCS